MTRIALMVALVSVLVAPLAAMASGAPAEPLNGGARAPSAKLRLLSANPLVVAGTGFEAHERITVTTLTSLGPRIRRIRATLEGRFRAQLGTFTQPCGKPFAVHARGAAGTMATLRLEAPPCVPPPVR